MQILMKMEIEGIRKREAYTISDHFRFLWDDASETIGPVVEHWKRGKKHENRQKGEAESTVAKFLRICDS